jgi:hypothetical protein
MNTILRTALTGLASSAALLSSVLIKAPVAKAVSLSINNPSFENPTIPPSQFTDELDFFKLGVNPPIPGWQIYDPNGMIAAADPNTNYPKVGIGRTQAISLPGGPPDGVNNAFVNLPPASVGIGNGVVGLTQTLTSTLTPNTTYTLKVDVGNLQSFILNGNAYDFNGFPGYRAEILAGGDVLAVDNNTLTPAEGKFLTSVVSYTASSNDPNIGKPLQIRLINIDTGPGTEVDFDNVQLDATDVPEPTSTLGFLVVGAVGTISSILKKLLAYRASN